MIQNLKIPNPTEIYNFAQFPAGKLGKLITGEHKGETVIKVGFGFNGYVVSLDSYHIWKIDRNETMEVELLPKGTVLELIQE